MKESCSVSFLHGHCQKGLVKECVFRLTNRLFIVNKIFTVGIKNFKSLKDINLQLKEVIL